MVFLPGAVAAQAQQTGRQGVTLLLNNTAKAFPLFDKGVAAAVCIDGTAAPVVQVAAQAFSNDVQLVTNKASKLLNEAGSEKNLVVAGTVGQSALMEAIAREHPAVNAIKGKWETFYINIIRNPFHPGGKILLIAGSDPRGTAFGIFEVSRAIGVHPFYWWADVVPRHRNALYLSVAAPVQQSPDVRYRGIFLNDEDWGLNPWAARKMDIAVKDIGPRTYEKVFELLLRLKANYIWPAMHHRTKAFWYYKENPELAKKYAIVLGASHCEPMLRNNVSEWVDEFRNEYGVPPGEWRYDRNKEQIFRYWDDRVKASVNNDAVYTIGMRGIHDGGMPGPATLPAKKALLQQVIADQRGMLTNHLNNRIENIPQIFCPYKEVLDIYQSGMELPGDVTIAWADDNHGYIRQLPDPAEQQRAGRGGIYYHLSYFGKPADYLWLSSISPTLISYEMTKAYRFTADRLWVFNVGDIKPAELETQFALDLAWNVHAWPPEKAQVYVEQWAADIFGKSFSKAIADIKNRYYQLAAEGKPEHLNKVSYTEAAARQRLSSYAAIAKTADSLRKYIPQQLQDAYFQLVYYPVMGAQLMNEKILLPRLATGPGLRDAREKAMAAYRQIQDLTKQYNTAIANGKWNGMMDAAPRKLAVFNTPDSVADVKDSKNVPVVLPAPRQSISAAGYSKQHVPPHETIQTIPHLGIGGVGITTTSWRSYDTAALQQMPYVEYTVAANAPEVALQVKCLPTFSLYKGAKLRYGIAVNGSRPQWVNIQSKADTDDWAVNVLRGFAAGITRHAITGNTVTIRLYLPDPGLVVNWVDLL